MMKAKTCYILSGVWAILGIAKGVFSLFGIGSSITAGEDLGISAIFVFLGMLTEEVQRNY